MFHPRRRDFSAVVASAIAIGSALTGVAAAADEPASQDLSAKISSLQTQIEQLRTEQATAQQQRQADQQKSSLDNVLGDADTRSKLLNMEGMTAGYVPDRGFLIRSEDGNFSLHPWFLMQFRDVTNYRDKGKNGGADSDTQNGFDVHYMKLAFDGTAFTPDLTYQFIWNSNRDNGIMALTIGEVTYHLPNTDWSVRGGQYKNPLDHEELISDQFQMAAERSLTEDLLANGEGYIQGVSAIYAPGGPLRAEVAFTDGFNSLNQGFQDFPTTSANYGVAGRAEYKIFGNWKDYEHFTSLGDHHDLLVVGGGADLTGIGHREQLLHVADVQYNTGPLGLYAAYMGRYTARGGLNGSDTYDPSLRLQASYLFSHHLEAFGRYDYVHFDGKEFAPGTHSNIHEITIGANYYLYGQHAKFTLDLSYLPNGSPVSDSPTGVLTDNNHAEFLLRGQFQLWL